MVDWPCRLFNLLTHFIVPHAETLRVSANAKRTGQGLKAGLNAGKRSKSLKGLKGRRGLKSGESGC